MYRPRSFWNSAPEDESIAGDQTLTSHTARRRTKPRTDTHKSPTWESSVRHLRLCKPPGQRLRRTLRRLRRKGPHIFVLPKRVLHGVPPARPQDGHVHQTRPGQTSNTATHPTRYRRTPAVRTPIGPAGKTHHNAESGALSAEPPARTRTKPAQSHHTNANSKLTKPKA
jgi:hypothetical protein